MNLLSFKVDVDNYESKKINRKKISFL